MWRRTRCARSLVRRPHGVRRGNDRSWTLADPGDGGPLPELVGPVGWDADSRHLMLQVNREPATQWWYVRHRVDRPHDHRHGVPDERVKPRTIRARCRSHPSARGSVGRDLQHRPRINLYRLVEFDAGNQSLVPHDSCPSRAVGCASASAHRARTRRGRICSCCSATGDHYDLYRWSEGDASPALVAHNITAADW